MRDTRRGSATCSRPHHGGMTKGRGLWHQSVREKGHHPDWDHQGLVRGCRARGRIPTVPQGGRAESSRAGVPGTGLGRRPKE